MVFKPGQSGNPSGLNLESVQRKRIARLELEKYLDKAIAVIGEQLQSGDPENAQWATKMIMDYVAGKPAQSVELADADGKKLDISINIKK